LDAIIFVNNRNSVVARASLMVSLYEVVMGRIDSIWRIEWVVFDSAQLITQYTLVTILCSAANIVTYLTTQLISVQFLFSSKLILVFRNVQELIFLCISQI